MLTDKQKRILEDFYTRDAARVIYNKKERSALWSRAVARAKDIELGLIQRKCPALSHQINRSYLSGDNIQSAIFSECSYAQTLANMFELDNFQNCANGISLVPENIRALLPRNMVARYIYWNRNNVLIQAGGHNGIDCVLINPLTRESYAIEFKEPSAKTSEPDLPKYHEDGRLLVTPGFLEKYPQFRRMLDEQKDLNFFAIMGNNMHDFSPESVEAAVSDNYNNASKMADVICTEDESGFLVMIPSNQVAKWANIEGEIRPAGRNHYRAWTPRALNRFLVEHGANITNDTVSIAKDSLEVRRERGGDRRISGYKINPLFFVYHKDCQEMGDMLVFAVDKIQQLNPTIAGKMFFKNLSYNDVKDYYMTQVELQ